MTMHLARVVARYCGTMQYMHWGGSGRWQGFELALLGVLLGLVSGCGSDDDGGDGGSTPPLERPAGSLSWRRCGNVECAEVEVPIDYDAPEAGTIPIAINRARASDGLPYRGVIFMNPGGPGVAGKELVTLSAGNLRRVFPGFDFVAFDPRGVGESAALACTIDIDLAQLYADSGAEGLFAGLAATSQRCAEENGPLFQHMGSRAVVADIDRIRAALGHEEINFYGLSYGTRLGALYAMTFPERARAVVLDAPVPPSANIIEFADGQFEALLEAQAAFFAGCAAGTLDCPPDTEALFPLLLADQGEEGRQAGFVSSWALLLSTPPGRDLLAAVMRGVAAAVQGDQPMAAAMDMMGTMDASDLVPAVNAVANLSTNCTDNRAAPLGVSEAQELMDSFAQRSTDFATQGLAALTCSGWNVTSDPAPETAFTPRVPPLVIGGVADSLTPLQWARDNAAAIPGASLLVSEHYGHGAIVFGGPCLGPHLRRYFENLTPVPADTICPAP
jgi:pimeloyl-ACP methyl ester carboxylesterase